MDAAPSERLYQESCCIIKLVLWVSGVSVSVKIDRKSGGRMKPIKILAVDDDVAILDFYSSLLSKAGYQVETAVEATAAIILFKQAPADLLILDVAMPSGGGKQVLEVVSSLIQEGVPIVFVTGLPEKIVPWVSGMANVRVLKKPVDSKELISVISGFLPKSGQ